MGDVFQGLFLITFIGFLVMCGVKFVTKKSAGELYTENEKYQKVSKIKRYIGIACIIFLALASITKEFTGEDKKQSVKVEQQEHIYDNAKIVDLKNGPGTETIGKVSVLKINSSNLTQEALEDWYFNYASKNVGDKGEKWNFAVIVYEDKPNIGTFYNGVITKDVPIKKNDKDDTYNMDGYGDLYVDDGNGHLKKFKQEEINSEVKTGNIDESIIIKEWSGKIENIAGRYQNDLKNLWAPSMQILGNQASSQEELYQNHKVVYQNLQELSNKLINDEMMYREIRISNDLSSDKKEKMMAIQNLYADGVKKMREAVDLTRLMVMKSSFPKEETDKVRVMIEEASKTFNDAYTSYQGLIN